MIAAQHDEGAIKVATDACLEKSMRVLQLFITGDEPAHVSYLLSVMNPPKDAIVVDVGCGVGEVARLMIEERPDLGFLLLNLSAYQLGLCPDTIEKVQADMHDMPLMHSCADVVMVNYALGYASLDQFLGEAARVLKPGGMLFIYDLSHNRNADSEPCALMREKFAYKVYSRNYVRAQAACHGFKLDLMRFPPASSNHLEPLLDAEYRAVMEQVSGATLPTIWRFIKDPEA